MLVRYFSRKIGEIRLDWNKGEETLVMKARVEIILYVCRPAKLCLGMIGCQYKTNPNTGTRSNMATQWMEKLVACVKAGIISLVK